jgi:RES domain-containing protein
VIVAWRITKQKHARSAFTGEGARLYGGRWNSKGRAVVYAAESRSLALTEMLVHLQAEALLLHYVLFRCEIGESLVREIDLADLPKSWAADPAPKRDQAVGDKWIDSAASAVLRVPSAVVIGEMNYLLNPAHPDFAKIAISPQKFRIDKRLK